MPKPLNLTSLYSLARDIEIRLNAGNDLKSAFIEVSTMDIFPGDTFREAIQRLKQKQPHPMAHLLFDLLTLGNSGIKHLSTVLQSYRILLKVLIRLERESISHFFLPQFQAWTAVAATLLVSFMPFAFPDSFTSFLISSPDLFFGGLAGCAVGLGILYFMILKSKCRFQEEVSRLTFLYLLMIFIRNGWDILSAWNRSLEILNVSDSLRRSLFISSEKSDAFQESLFSLESKLPLEWRKFMAPLRSILLGASHFSDKLFELAEHERERIEFESLHRLRRTAASTIVPVQLLVFPSALFLLVGPQILEVLQ